MPDSLMFLSQVGRLIPFSGWELALIGLYLSMLVVIGAVGYIARKEYSLRDFYLAGPGIGFFVLLLTLYATQYSGNTLIGFTGRTYKVGFFWTVSIHFMTAIVVFYLAYAPRLYPLAKKHGFVTPADFIAHRYRSKVLVVAVSLIMIFGIANFLVAQLMAMGRVMQGLTDYDPALSYMIGVVVLALIVVGYETLGGFRAVAWTDAMQGGILMLGFGLLLVLVLQNFGSLEDATRQLLERDRQAVLVDGDDAKRVAHPPATRQTFEWISYILAVGIGAALYPQAIQRIYAARKVSSLKRSLFVMAFLPLATTLVSLVVGIIAMAHIDVETLDADTVLSEVCRQIQASSFVGRVLVAILFAAILAAIMSTADSVLLSISSMFTKDLVATCWPHPLTDRRLTVIGKGFSWAVMASAVVTAIVLQRTGRADLVGLLDRKFDLLVQLAPAFMIGIHWRRMSALPVLLGIAAGLAVALGISFFGPTAKPAGIHAGLYGLAVNLLLSIGGSWLLQKAQHDSVSKPSA